MYKDRPGLLILSPPCTLFSKLQVLSPYGLPEVRDPEGWAEAVAFVDLSMELAEIQRKAGRSFVFEHSWQASSWDLQSVNNIRNKKDVGEVIFDMCRFGMVAQDKDGEAPVRKTTRVLSNDPGILGRLDKRCEGGHLHVALVSGRPEAAAIYPIKMCEEIVAGFDPSRRGLAEFVLMQSSGIWEEAADMCDPADNVVKADAGHYWDDLKSKVIDPLLARRARQEEVEVFRMRDVYELVDHLSREVGESSE